MMNILLFHYFISMKSTMVFFFFNYLGPLTFSPSTVQQFLMLFGKANEKDQMKLGQNSTGNAIWCIYFQFFKILDTP